MRRVSVGAVVALAAAVLAFVSTVSPANAQTTLTSFKRIDLPVGFFARAMDPASGWVFALSSGELKAFTSNGFYAGSVSVGANAQVIADGADLYVTEPLLGKVQRLNRFSLETVRTFDIPFHQPAEGIKVGNALWITDRATSSLVKLDLGSGTITNYPTWGAVRLAQIGTTSQAVAFGAPSAPNDSFVLDLSVDPPTAGAVVSNPAVAFATDPRGSGQVFGFPGSGAPGNGPVTAYAVPALTATAESYNGTTGASGQGRPPRYTSLGGGWIATVYNDIADRVSLFRPGTGATTATSTAEIGQSLVTFMDWRPFDATLVVGLQDRFTNAPRLEYFAVTPPTSPTSAYGEFTPVSPYRVFDTRTGTVNNPRVGSLAPGEVATVQIAGAGPLPASGVEAVAVNLTVVGSTAPTYVTLYPSDGTLPNASNVNLVPGQLKVNAAFVRLGEDGAIRVYNAAGNTPVVIDIEGFFSDSTGPPGARFHPVTPTRLLDSRSSIGVLPDGWVHTLTVGGGAIPPNPRAVMLNVTVVNPAAANYVVVYPASEGKPFASNVNAFPGQTVPNLVVAKVDGGQVAIANTGGAAHVIVDIVGWWDDDRSTNAGRYLPDFQPLRWSDTRTRLGPIPRGNYLRVTFGNFPPDAPYEPSYLGGTGALVLNTTVIALDGGGYAVVYPGELGPNAPFASNLNFAAGETVANLTVSRLGTDERVNFSAAGSAVHFIVDLQGFFTNEHY